MRRKYILYIYEFGQAIEIGLIGNFRSNILQHSDYYRWLVRQEIKKIKAFSSHLHPCTQQKDTYWRKSCILYEPINQSTTNLTQTCFVDFHISSPPHYYYHRYEIRYLASNANSSLDWYDDSWFHDWLLPSHSLRRLVL